MKIIHMSDIHIADRGEPIWDTDTRAHFDKAIEKISQEKDIDAIFITGDIADKGAIWSYEYVDKAMSKLGIPTYVCPGNHDWIPNMCERLKYCKKVKSEIIGDWRFVFLDSTIIDPDDVTQNKARGYFKDADKYYIEFTSQECDHPTCILLHHSPIEPGGWMNKKLLENRDQFKEFISSQKNVKLVLFGHIHYSMTETHDGVLYSSAPSIGFAFDKDMPKYQIIDHQEGYSIIHIGPYNNIDIEIVRI